MTEDDLHIRANGKLLLAGEYFVLDGALSLAIPTKFGQTFKISYIPEGKDKIHWKSLDHKGFPWFSVTISTRDFSARNSTSKKLDQTLCKLLKIADKLGEPIPEGTIFIESTLDFPRDWGLGTSSTLIFSIAKWLEIDPFLLLNETFGGSGYDVACANSESAIFYSIKNKEPFWKPVLFNPPFQKNIAFLYLGIKKNSREGIKTYREKGLPTQSLINEISHLAKEMTLQYTVAEFITIINRLEKLTGDWIQIKPIKELLFPDFNGGIKSLGAWGGDFVLLASELGIDYMRDYFNKKGLDVFLEYNEMVK